MSIKEAKAVSPPNISSRKSEPLPCGSHAPSHHVGATPPSHLALEGLDGQVHDHVGLQRLLLDEALEAHVALEGADAVVDQHVALQVSRQRELPGAHVTLVSLHPLRTENPQITIGAWGY